LLACGSAASENTSSAEQHLTSADGNLSAALTFQSQWAGGYCANIAVSNGGKQTSTAWSVTVALNGSQFSNGWNAQLTQTSAQITGKNLSYNGTLAPSASTSWGFCATGAGLPTLVTVAGSGSGGGSGGAGAGGASGSGGTAGSTSATGGTAGTASGGKGGTGGSSGGTGGGTGACNLGTTHTGGTQHCSNSTGSLSGGYSYQLWSNGTGSGCMTPYGGGDAAFKANWSNSSDFLARVGLGWNETQTFDQLGTISSDFAYTKTGTGGGFSFIGIYGWSNNPLIEFYIVEDWFGSSAPTGGGTKKGSFSVDGGTYNIYQHQQNNQPSIHGTATFQQFFSVRQTPRQCGHISITEHFKQWASLGMTLGKMEEARILVEVGGGTGSIDFTTATVVAK
jgi:hypothetical protein